MFTENYSYILRCNIVSLKRFKDYSQLWQALINFRENKWYRNYYLIILMFDEKLMKKSSVAD